MVDSGAGASAPSDDSVFPYRAFGRIAPLYLAASYDTVPDDVATKPRGGKSR